MVKGWLGLTSEGRETRLRAERGRKKKKRQRAKGKENDWLDCAIMAADWLAGWLAVSCVLALSSTFTPEIAYSYTATATSATINAQTPKSPPGSCPGMSRTKLAWQTGERDEDGNDDEDDDDSDNDGRVDGWMAR